MEKSKVLQVDIVGNRYYLDDSQENLIPVNKGLTVIHTGELEVAMDHEWERFGYYNLINNCLYHPPENLRQLPEGIIGFSIPSHRDMEEARKTTLVVYAETAELFDTDLARLVAENRIREKDEQIERQSQHTNHTKKEGHQRKTMKKAHRGL